MKYIKTKNGVYKISKILKNGDLLIKGKFHINKEVADECFKTENLEELCEGFYIDEGNEFSFYQENAYENFEEAKRDFFTNFDRTSTLYAFIKTSKGLIYVAKMNDKGELVLI